MQLSFAKIVVVKKREHTPSQYIKCQLIVVFLQSLIYCSVCLERGLFIAGSCKRQVVGGPKVGVAIIEVHAIGGVVVGAHVVGGAGGPKV